MSRRTPIEELREEEPDVETPRRRSSRIAAAVTTRRASTSEDTPAKIGRSKRLSLSQESSLEKDNVDDTASSVGPSTPQKRTVTRSASKSPSALAKAEEVPMRRTRRKASVGNLTDDEDQKDERGASPAPTKVTARRRSLRSMSTSPTFEATGNKAGTPRKSSRATSSSPTSEITKSASSKPRGRRLSVAERIVPLEAIEETETKMEELSESKSTRATNSSPTSEITKSAPSKPRGRRLPVAEWIVPLVAIEETESKIEELSGSKDSDETQEKLKNKGAEEEKAVSATEETSDENLPFTKKKAAVMKKQNLQPIEEKIIEESESASSVEAENTEKVSKENLNANKIENIATANKEGLRETFSEVGKSATKPEDLKTNTEEITSAKKKALKRESNVAETPEAKSKVTKYSPSLLKSKRSPEELKEEKELKEVLGEGEENQKSKSPRRSVRLSGSETPKHEESKQPLQTDSDAANIAEDSEKSFRLNISQSDASKEDLDQQKTGESSSSLVVSQENSLNTSSSSNTSDKENQQQINRVEKVEDITKKKLIVLAENLKFDMKSPAEVEKIASTEDSGNRRKSRRSGQSFYEPMEVDDYPSDYDFSGQDAKKEEIHKNAKEVDLSKTSEFNESLTEKSSQPLESPKISKAVESPAEKSLKQLESPKTSEVSAKQDVSLLMPSKESEGTKKQEELLSPIIKTSSDVKVDVSQVKVYSVTTKLAEVGSPKRRSARLLNQSQNNSPEQEKRSLVNRAPKQKAAKRSIEEDLEKVQVSEGKLAVSIDEDLHDASESPLQIKETPSVDDKEKDKISGNDSNVEGNKNDKEEVVETEKKSKSLNESGAEEILRATVFKENENQNKSNVDVTDKAQSKTQDDSKKKERSLLENFGKKEGINKDETKNDADLEEIQKGDTEVIKESDLELCQEIEGHTVSKELKQSKRASVEEESKFSEDSEGENITKRDQTKDDPSSKNKENDIENSEQGKVNFGENEEPKFSEDSADEDLTKRNRSQKDSSSENVQKGQGDSRNDEKPKSSDDFDGEDIMMLDDSKKDFSDNKENNKDGSEHGKTNFDEGDKEPKFSEDSDDEDIKKDEPTKEFALEKKPKRKGSAKLKRKAVSSEDDDEPKFSEDSDDEDIKKDEPTKEFALEKKPKDKGSAKHKRKSVSSEDDDEPKFSEDSNDEDIKKDEPIKKSALEKKQKGKSSANLKSKEDSSEDDEPKFSEDSDDEYIRNDELTKEFALEKKPKDKGSAKLKSKADSSEDDDEPKFSEDSNDEDIKKDEPTKKFPLEKEQKGKGSAKLKSKADSSEDDELKFSEDSNDEDVKKDEPTKKSPLEKKQKGKGSAKLKRKADSSEGDDEPKFSEESDSEEVKKKPKDADVLESQTKTHLDERSKPKERRTALPVVVSSASDEDGDVFDLDAKIDTLIANQQDEDSNSSCESVTHYLDDMAEEGEEDTPSEGSNDIIDKGESVGSTESEIDSDETYENDSFIDDDVEDEFLSGEEYDLGQEKKKTQPKTKRSRIIKISDSEEENKENASPAANKTNMKQPKATEPKAKMINGLEEDSDLEKMSTRPYCGLTPPSIMSLRDSLSDSEKAYTREDKQASVLINKEDNLKSLEELKQQEHPNENVQTPAVQRKASLAATPKTTPVVLTTFTPNNSVLEDDVSQSNKASRKRHSSITIHENIKLKDIEEGNISNRISKVVDVFCTSFKEDGKDSCGNIALNISLEFLKSPSPSEEIHDEDASTLEENEKLPEKAVEGDLEKPLSSELLNESKQLSTKESKDVAGEVLEAQLSMEQPNEPKPETIDVKLSSKKQKKWKLVKKQDEFIEDRAQDLQAVLEDHLGTRKRQSGEPVEKPSLTDELEQNQNKTVSSSDLKDDWETLPEDVCELDTPSSKIEVLPSKKKLSRKERKRKKQKASNKTVSSEEKTAGQSTNLSKFPTPPEIAVVIPSDSDMSDDLDKEIKEKYTSNAEFVMEGKEIEFENISNIVIKKDKKKKSKKVLDIVPQNLKGKQKLQPVDDGANETVPSKLEKKIKKRKRDKSNDQQQDVKPEIQVSIGVIKTKKQKDKLKAKALSESPAIVSKKPKKFKSSCETDILSDEVFLENLEETTKKKKKMKSVGENIKQKPNIELPQPSQPGKKKEKFKHYQAGPSSAELSTEPAESKFQYFPSRVLAALTKDEKLEKAKVEPNENKQRKKPKVRPSTTMSKRLWETDVVDSPVMPSSGSTAKKMKLDIESFHSKDFKNLMLYNPSRCHRIDTKSMLKKKQKTKF